MTRASALIVRTPGTLGPQGRARFDGTRIGIANFLQQLETWGSTELLGFYEGRFTEEHIQAALDFEPQLTDEDRAR